MEFLQLQYFCTVAQTGNITHAARHHGIPQPAMSQTISRLEKELNVSLFDRKGNHIYLNEKGKLFYSYINNALNNINSGLAALKENSEQLTGTIKLLVLENRNIIIDLVAEFSSLHPKVTFSISHDFNSMHTFNCDLCIADHSPQVRFKKSIPIIQEDLLLAVQKDHPLASRKSVSISELINEPIISMPEGSSLYKIAFECFHKNGLDFNTTIICDDPFSVRRYVSKGMGVAFIPARSWHGLIKDDTVLISLEESGFHRTTKVLWDDSRYISNTVQAFRDYITSRI